MSMRRLFVALCCGWVVNGIVLTLLWWVGYYCLLEKGMEWIDYPLHAALWTHGLIKVIITWTLIMGALEGKWKEAGHDK